MTNPPADAVITTPTFPGEELLVVDVDHGIAQDLDTGGLRQINWDAIEWADTGRRIDEDGVETYYCNCGGHGTGFHLPACPGCIH